MTNCEFEAGPEVVSRNFRFLFFVSHPLMIICAIVVLGCRQSAIQHHGALAGDELMVQGIDYTSVSPFRRKPRLLGSLEWCTFSDCYVPLWAW